jgi:hypothetical protein
MPMQVLRCAQNGEEKVERQKWRGKSGEAKNGKAKSWRLETLVMEAAGNGGGW